MKSCKRHRKHSFCSHLIINSSLIINFPDFDKRFRIGHVTYVINFASQWHLCSEKLQACFFFFNFSMKTILSNVLSTLVCTAFMHIRAKGDGFNCWTTVLPGIYGEENLPRIDQAGFYYNDQVLQAAQYSQRTSFLVLWRQKSLHGTVCSEFWYICVTSYIWEKTHRRGKESLK